MAADNFRYCSRQPGMPGKKAFCVEVFKYPWAVTKCSHLFFSKLVNNLPMHEVNAIGRKLEGLLGSSLAAALGVNLMNPHFQF